MKKVKISVLFLIVFSFFAVFAQEEPDQETTDSDSVAQEDADQEVPDEETPDEDIPVADNKGNMIGGDPIKSWEDGGQDFFVIFNSNLDDKVIFADEDCAQKEDGKCVKAKNPQGDTCLDSSSFKLDNFHIPEDAIIEEAYLVWMGAVDPSKLNAPTDNEVNLSFVQTADQSVKHEENIKGEEGKKLTSPASFAFEGIRFKNDVKLNCSETNAGEPVADYEIGYFTYRVDVTKFFNQIYEANKAAGHEEGSGEYYGTYTFSGLECTEADAYRCNTTMVSGWSLFFIYRSKHIKPKKIYFYNGLAHVYGEESVSNVSGFELPLYPAVRLTTMIGEGDPSLTVPILPEEGIFLKGQNAEGRYRLKNECNFFDEKDGHLEVYNSKSSIINWDPKASDNNKIQCVEGGQENADHTIQYNYGIDVDTFLLDSGEDINLQEHLEKGNNSMSITLSVNQDAIVTNFMVLSVDIKGADFDIPDEEEKYFCACPAAENNSVDDYYCPHASMDREFYYLVRIQNWGEDETGAVTIRDELDPQLEYVKGSTDYATEFDEKGDGTDWTSIEDKAGGVFPLSGDGVKLSEKMVPCEEKKKSDGSVEKICKNKILVRYKVFPKTGIAKNYVFSNIAYIKDANSDEAYKTNKSYPLKLRPGNCVPESVCSKPTPEMCGGVKDNKECGTQQNPNCPTGYVCENFKCKDNVELMCSNAEVELALGKNSPQSDNAIIIPRDNGGEPLVVGQFTLQASNCDDEKVFNFDGISVHYNTKRDNNFNFTDFELIYDANGNGVYDDADSIINDSVSPNNGYVYFPIKNTDKKYVGKSLNYFIIRAKVGYNNESISASTSFYFFLEESDIRINSDIEGAVPDVKNPKLDFATFYLEPTGDYFIVTSGPHDPAVPAISEMNSNIPVMQIKTKSIGKDNSIKQFKVKVPSAKFVKFGEKNGISGISIWLDTNNDGLGDVKLAEKTTFDSTESTAITLDSFSQEVNYTANEEKYFVVYVDFDMVNADPAMAGKIQIPKGGIKLGVDASPYELPLNSKTYTYACQEGDASCATEKKGGGCAVLEVESGNTNIIVIAAVLSAAAMLGFALLRKKIF